MVIQEQAAELFLSVRDSLASYGRFHGLRGAMLAARVDEVIEQFGLRDEAARKVMDLSGGFRRRVQVAKVFMVDTPVLFLDEFSTGMDPILKRAVMTRLRDEARRGRTIVLTTQILTEAEELCDDILIINRGRQVARGDLHTLKLLSSGVHEVTITYAALPPGIEAELARPRSRCARDRTEHRDPQPQGEPPARAGAGGSSLTARGEVLHVELGGASLEDIFVELTKP